MCSRPLEMSRKFVLLPLYLSSRVGFSRTSALCLIYLECARRAGRDHGLQARVALAVFCLGGLLYLRLRINGGASLYQWTVSENHIHRLPSLLVVWLPFVESDLKLVAGAELVLRAVSLLVLFQTHFSAVSMF